MSAAPSRDLGRMRHDDDADIAVLHAGHSSSDVADAGDRSATHERAPGSMWPIERSPRNEARPRIAFIGTVAPRPPLRCARRRATGPRRLRAVSACTGTSTSSMVFCPTSDLPRALTASTAAPKRLRQIVVRAVRRQFLAQRHEQRAVQRARGAADLHHQRHADRLQRFRQRLAASLVELGQHRLEAALHVEPVIAVADGLVERRQFVGMRSRCTGRPSPMSLRCNRCIDRHAWRSA